MFVFDDMKSNLFQFNMKTYAMSAHRHNEATLMSTNNIGFEKRTEKNSISLSSSIHQVSVNIIPGSL